VTPFPALPLRDAAGTLRSPPSPSADLGEGERRVGLEAETNNSDDDTLLPGSEPPPVGGRPQAGREGVLVHVEIMPVGYIVAEPFGSRRIGSGAQE
jgi:hypothetical protein